VSTTEYYIGLMSGTSIDAIDAALVTFKQQENQLVSFVSYPVPESIRDRLHQFIQAGPEATLEEYAHLDVVMGHLFTEAVTALLKKSGLQAEQITAIGSHGQTLYHQPDGNMPTSLQAGDPNIIAEKSTITTVADFRRRDIAAGGQGAPLVPAYHQAMLQSTTENRCIVNIGGIANITVLPANLDASITGFDTGPGNTLLDQWSKLHRGNNIDIDAAFAKQGIANKALLDKLLSDPYFSKPIPKSTGREYFHLSWLDKYIQNNHLSPEDIQATLCELTAFSILDAIKTYAQDTEKLFVCGGGVHNPELMRLLESNEMNMEVNSSETAGINPDHMEAMAFAWLARQTILGLTGNLTSVTGARTHTLLGGIYPGKKQGQPIQNN